MIRNTIMITVVLAVLTATPAFGAESFAEAVISYDAGSTPALKYLPPDYTSTVPYTDSSAALGKPAGVTEGAFGGTNILSPFNAAAKVEEIVSVGEGGHLTLRLTNYAEIAPGFDIGLFGSVNLAEADWMNPTGTTGDPVFAFGVDTVTVEVSEDGAQWTSIGDVTVDMPANYYVDASSPYLADGAGLTPADFSKPFDPAGGLSAFDGQDWAGVLSVLDGSAGGTWLDLSATGLPRVGYVRFSVADDGDAETALNFELDAVSLAAGHIGDPVPEPATFGLLTLGALVSLRRRRN